MMIANQPYNDLPFLPPNIELETKPILKLCIEARTALGALQQAGALIPNQTMLINVIPLLEAQGSSEIENIVTTTDKLFQYADNMETADQATKEALRYRTALYQGVTAIKERPLSDNTAIMICQVIKGVDLGIRQTEVVLKDGFGEVVYTPPSGKITIERLLQNWTQFLHEDDDLDPLVKMAVLHYQFEAIHPFVDGNGRTGRILNILYLIDKGLLNLPILYLSRYIIEHKASYYQGVKGVTQYGDWQTWLTYMLTAIKETSEWTTAKILAIKQLHEYTAEYVKQHASKVYSRELIDVIFEQPYCRIANLVDKQIAKRQTASNYLKTLVEIGVLEQTQAGKEILFINPKLMQLLQSRDNMISEV
ncbi:protein adenylyltransferase Fic [Psychrobacter sp. I-STPA10]|uniref:protein adenylyltransferase Fic n=1 Tax=Psychrobacter sp. I-STPA10 TaxID=2585769 RepID=UPI0022A8A012|nr:Fic family protein [Psychrobacter sp. I-STPA10]